MSDSLPDVASEITEQQARQLVGQILRDARAHNHKALLAIDADPDTERLLGLLPESATHDANLHIRAAHTWRRKKNQKAIVKLDAAQTALDGLDVVLAKGLLRKIDSSILDEAEIARFDELLLAAEARAIELEDIKKDLPPAPPDKKQKKRGPFRRR